MDFKILLIKGLPKPHNGLTCDISSNTTKTTYRYLTID